MNDLSAKPIKTVVLAASPQEASSLAQLVERSGAARIVAKGLFPWVDGNMLEQILSVEADLILVEIESESSFKALSILNARCHPSWLLVTSSRTEPSFIIEAVRAGAREFLPKPLTADGLAEALRRFTIGSQQERGAEIDGAIYLVTSAREGCGTTTTAINLAASIAKLPGTSVGLLDFSSPLGDAATFLDLKSEFDLTDALNAGQRLDPVLLGSFMSETRGFSVLAGLRRFEQNGGPSSESFRLPVEVAKKTFTHTIIDASVASHLDRLRILLECSDQVLVVLTPEIPALWRTYRFLSAIDEPSLEGKLKLLVNRFANNNEIQLSDIENTLQHAVAWSLPNDFHNAYRAIRSGKPIVTINRSQLASQYAELAISLTGIKPPQPEGVFKKLFRKRSDS